MPRYRPTLAQSRADRERRKLEESIRCPTHNVYYGREGDFVSGWISIGFTDPPGNLGLAHPTHWQPLPAAPEATG